MEPQFRLSMKEVSVGSRQGFNWSRLFLWLGVLLVVAGAIYGLFKYGNTPISTNPSKNSQIAVVLPNDQVTGNTASKVVVVEYADFQCPACGFFYPTLKRLEAELAGQVQFVFRNFPLASIHPNAKAAARAAGAAGLQKLFWPMHDLLYEKQNDWAQLADPSTKFLEYATSLGLDLTQWQADLSNSLVKNKIEADYSAGIAYGVLGTPTVFVNGSLIRSDYQSIKNAIDAALNETSK